MLPKRLKAFCEHRLLVPLSTGAVVTLLVAATLLGGGPEEVLGALPAILLAVFLACGRYPGEELVLRLAAPRRGARPRATTAILPLRPRWRGLSPRLAFLAGSRPERGPPPLAVPLTP